MITAMPRIAIAVSNFDAIVSTFRDQFGMPVIDFSESSMESLGAKLAMCVPPGGSNIELMCPGVPEAPLSQSLQRFLDKRGEGLFALMLEAPVPDEEAERLLDNGLNVLPLMDGAGGRDIHPNSLHGVLIRVYPNESFQGTMEETDASAGLSGIARVEIAVNDVAESVDTYGSRLGLDAGAPQSDEARGVKSAQVRPPSGGVIELVEVEDETMPYARKLAQFLAERGEGMFQLVLESADLARSSELLRERALSVSTSETGAVEVAKSDTHGAQISIESK